MTHQTRVGFTKVVFFIDSCDLPAIIGYILESYKKVQKINYKYMYIKVISEQKK